MDLTRDGNEIGYLLYEYHEYHNVNEDNRRKFRSQTSDNPTIWTDEESRDSLCFFH